MLKRIKIKFQQTVSIVLVVLLVLGTNVSTILAVETPDSPEAPVTSQQTTTDPAPTQTVETPQAAEQPQATEISQSASQGEPSPTPTAETTPTATNPAPTSNPESTPAPNTANQTGSQTSDGNLGETAITTQDANVSGTIATVGNTNLATDSQTGQIGSASIENTGNGSDSQNSGIVDTNESSATVQDNNANLNNNLNLEASSGNNSASENLGSSTITTGDANATGTILNAVNTNVDGVLVSETNIVEDHVGDIVLDFTATCISGCESDTSLTNSGNGSDSTNNGEITNTTDQNTFQTNEATVENEMVLFADSGNNVTDNNTGGDSTIKTGDANASGNIINFLNNNLAGNVIYNVVNIFGDLVGDIIIPADFEKYFASGEESGQTQVANAGNGSNSTNSGTLNQTDNQNTTQFNNADIVNNVELVATTGDNQTDNNTNGDNKITTGDANVDTQIINIANNNFVGGVWWIVLVNEAGNWVGRILGAPGTVVADNAALSPGAEFSVADDGSVNIVNAGNGTDSTNTGTVNNANNQTTEQSNTAGITNNVKLAANTGNNSASRNTGGDNTIESGDASVMLNIINFVNNNFAGGKVLLTVVNVFGSWTGDLLTPGATKDENNDSGIGDNETSNPPQANNNQNHQASNNSSITNNQQEEKTIKSTLKPVLVAGYRNIANAEVLGSMTKELSLPIDTIAGAQEGQKIKINLAWLLLILPLLLAAVIARRYIQTRLR